MATQSSRQSGVCVLRAGHSLGWSTPAPATDTSTSASALTTTSATAKRSSDTAKRRGQNKRRKREEVGLGRRQTNDEKLCQFACTEQECPFGAKCKYVHDVAHFVEHIKPKNIGKDCVFFDQRGACPYGFACLFGEKHTKRDADGKYHQVISDPAGLRYKKRNEISSDLQRQLRKRTYTFEYNPTSAKSSTSPRKPIDFRNKVYVAPLTTVGNLPFRRIVKSLGADITCGEMAMARNLLSAKASEWALIRRHESEDIFGVQLADSDPKVLRKCVTLLANETDIDFFDLNVGCPIDLVTECGAGSALMTRAKKLEDIVQQMTGATKGEVPVGVKMRMGWNTNKPNAHKIIRRLHQVKSKFPYGNAIAYISVHGRSRQQRYTKSARWDYINACGASAEAAAAEIGNDLKPIPIWGNGDIMSYTEYDAHLARQEDWVQTLRELEKEEEAEVLAANPNMDQDRGFQLAGCMLARGALIKPWICTEIKEKRHWDISSSERMDLLKDFVKFGLENWGSDKRGVDNTRRYLLEWMSFLHRYVPVGLIEPLYVPQRIHDRPPRFQGRDDLETLMGSPAVEDWIKISEMLLGPVTKNFVFQPKHKANAFARSTTDILESSLNT